MNFTELFLLAVGLSTDAFAVAVCAGLAMPLPTVKKSLVVGLYFGIFQAVMPCIGYVSATFFADSVIAYGHFIAFALLLFVGGKMIVESFKKEDCSDGTCPDGEKPKRQGFSLRPAHMLPLAVATSIDALAVGISFSFLQMRIVPAVLYIGITTLLLSMAGVKIGSVFGTRFKSGAELAGGIILVLIGLRILLEHLNIISVYPHLAGFKI